MPLLPLGSNNPKNPNMGNATASELKGDPDSLSEFDEYGTELHREARVWKVYVKETDKYDGDLVKGWNDSADVILVFAALFSAISSAFLIESSKALQEDPLIVISRTLLLIANGTQSPGSTSPTNSDSTDFTPSRTAIWVNTLWYLSLSLSLATSFIAILAKDWCHSFMKDRTGHPFDQTCRRQKKWDMIVRWKMSKLLGFLPSVIHLALLLFAIGLCITLWDTHIIVAVPVICVSGVAFGFYVSSSVAASFVDSFPYPTILSRIYRSQTRQLLWRLLCELPFVFGLILNGMAIVLVLIYALPAFFIGTPDFPIGESQSDIAHDNHQSYPSILVPVMRSILFLLREVYRGYYWNAGSIGGRVFEGLDWLQERIPTTLQGLKRALQLMNLESRPNNSTNVHGQNDLTTQALNWLISSCEVPQSVDIALQSIAGATSRISRDPLLDCKAPLHILRRLASTNLYKDLNAKSDAAVSRYVRALSFLGTPTTSGSGNARKEGSDLEASIWDLQMETERRIATLIEDGSFEPTRNNLEAFQIGSTMALISLKMLKFELGNAEIKIIFDSIIRLLKSHLDRTNVLHKTALLSLAQAATLFMMFVPASIAACQEDLSSPSTSAVIGENVPEPSGDAVVECHFVEAHTLISLFVRLAMDQSSFGPIKSLPRTCAILHNTLNHRGETNQLDKLRFQEAVLRRLIEQYTQDDQTLDLTYSFQSNSVSCCPLQSAYDSQCNLSSLESNLWFDIRNADSVTTRMVWPQLGSRIRRETKKAIISLGSAELDSVYNLPSDAEFNPATYLLIVEVMCRTQNTSTLLWVRGAQMLSKNPFPALSEGLTAALEQRDIVPLLEITSTSDNQTKQYFAKGQLWLLLSLYIYADDTASGRDKLKVQLDKCGRNGDESVMHRYQRLGQELYSAPFDGPMFRDLGLCRWADRLDECTSQFLGLRFWPGDGIASVPPEHRGLSSFTTWPRRAGNPSTNEPRPLEEVADREGERTHATNVTTEGEGATGRDGQLRSPGLVADTGEAETQGEDNAERADPSQDLEAATQEPPAGDDKSLADVNLQEEVGGVRGEENSRVSAAGDEQRVADEGNATEAINRPHSEGEEAKSDDAAHDGGNEGDVVIRMDRLDNRSDGATTSA